MDHNMPGTNHSMNGTDQGMNMPAGTKHMGYTHMTFFWGRNSEILFSGWPGTRTGMYVLALMFVFVLSVLVEWLSGCRWANLKTDQKPSSGRKISVGMVQTFVHGFRIGLAYLLMLALMSFNVGVLIAAIAGHILGFFVFRSRVFNESCGEDTGMAC